MRKDRLKAIFPEMFLNFIDMLDRYDLLPKLSPKSFSRFVKVKTPELEQRHQHENAVCNITQLKSNK